MINQINPEIRELTEKTLIGINVQMSIIENKTGLLWSKFSPRINEISNANREYKVSLQIYPSDYFEAFDPAKTFIKWAAVEVNKNSKIPKGMDYLILSGGKYAVFNYKGLSNDNSIFQYIYKDWLPNSKYLLDDRPHFEILGPLYRNNDPSSEEEIWIPITDQ